MNSKNLKSVAATLKIKHKFTRVYVLANEFWLSWNLLCNIENETNELIFHRSGYRRETKRYTMREQKPIIFLPVISESDETKMSELVLNEQIN